MQFVVLKTVLYLRGCHSRDKPLYPLMLKFCFVFLVVLDACIYCCCHTVSFVLDFWRVTPSFHTMHERPLYPSGFPRFACSLASRHPEFMWQWTVLSLYSRLSCAFAEWLACMPCNWEVWGLKPAWTLSALPHSFPNSAKQRKKSFTNSFPNTSSCELGPSTTCSLTVTWWPKYTCNV